MTYLCAGLFAEGGTDYTLLLPLLDRLIPMVAVDVLRDVPTIADSVGMKEPEGQKGERREIRIAATIHEYWDQCTLFVVHADGTGDPERALREQVTPGLDRARSVHSDIAAAACIPVREIEAWLLADPEPFRKLQLTITDPILPVDPEAVRDPKRVFQAIVAERSGNRLDHRFLYEFFGSSMSIPALRGLPAFRRFEAQLAEAIARAGRP